MHALLIVHLCSVAVTSKAVKTVPHSLCPVGFIPPECIHECRDGFYGVNCLSPCPASCVNSSCRPQSGECFRCKTGLLGPMCSKRCQAGTHGDNCTKQCPFHCRNRLCDPFSGYCQSCDTGFSGSKCDSVIRPPEAAAVRFSPANDASSHTVLYITVIVTTITVPLCIASLWICILKKKFKGLMYRRLLERELILSRIYRNPNDLEKLMKVTSKRSLNSENAMVDKLDFNELLKNNKGLRQKLQSLSSKHHLPCHRIPASRKMSKERNEKTAKSDEENEEDMNEMKELLEMNNPLLVSQAANYSKNLLFKTIAQNKGEDACTNGSTQSIAIKKPCSQRPPRSITTKQCTGSLGEVSTSVKEGSHCVLEVESTDELATTKSEGQPESQNKENAVKRSVASRIWSSCKKLTVFKHDLENLITEQINRRFISQPKDCCEKVEEESEKKMTEDESVQTEVCDREKPHTYQNKEEHPKPGYSLLGDLLAYTTPSVKSVAELSASKRKLTIGTQSMDITNTVDREKVRKKDIGTYTDRVQKIFSCPALSNHRSMNSCMLAYDNTYSVPGFKIKGIQCLREDMPGICRRHSDFVPLRQKMPTRCKDIRSIDASRRGRPVEKIEPSVCKQTITSPRRQNASVAYVIAQSQKRKTSPVINSYVENTFYQPVELKSLNDPVRSTVIGWPINLYNVQSTDDQSIVASPGDSSSLQASQFYSLRSPDLTNNINSMRPQVPLASPVKKRSKQFEMLSSVKKTNSSPPMFVDIKHEIEKRKRKSEFEHGMEEDNALKFLVSDESGYFIEQDCAIQTQLTGSKTIVLYANEWDKRNWERAKKVRTVSQPTVLFPHSENVRKLTSHSQQTIKKHVTPAAQLRHTKKHMISKQSDSNRMNRNIIQYDSESSEREEKRMLNFLHSQEWNHSNVQFYFENQQQESDCKYENDCYIGEFHYCRKRAQFANENNSENLYYGGFLEDVDSLTRSQNKGSKFSDRKPPKSLIHKVSQQHQVKCSQYDLHGLNYLSSLRRVHRHGEPGNHTSTEISAGNEVMVKHYMHDYVQENVFNEACVNSSEADERLIDSGCAFNKTTSNNINTLSPINGLQYALNHGKYFISEDVIRSPYIDMPRLKDVNNYECCHRQDINNLRNLQEQLFCKTKDRCSFSPNTNVHSFEQKKHVFSNPQHYARSITYEPEIQNGVRIGNPIFFSHDIADGVDTTIKYQTNVNTYTIRNSKAFTKDRKDAAINVNLDPKGLGSHTADKAVLNQPSLSCNDAYTINRKSALDSDSHNPTFAENYNVLDSALNKLMSQQLKEIVVVRTKLDDTPPQLVSFHGDSFETYNPNQQVHTEKTIVSEHTLLRKTSDVTHQRAHAFNIKLLLSQEFHERKSDSPNLHGVPYTSSPNLHFALTSPEALRSPNKGQQSHQAAQSNNMNYPVPSLLKEVVRLEEEDLFSSGDIILPLSRNSSFYTSEVHRGRKNETLTNFWACCRSCPNCICQERRVKLANFHSAPLKVMCEQGVNITSQVTTVDSSCQNTVPLLIHKGCLTSRLWNCGGADKNRSVIDRESFFYGALEPRESSTFGDFMGQSLRDRASLKKSLNYTKQIDQYKLPCLCYYKTTSPFKPGLRFKQEKDKLLKSGDSNVKRKLKLREHKGKKNIALIFAPQTAEHEPHSEKKTHETNAQHVKSVRKDSKKTQCNERETKLRTDSGHRSRLHGQCADLHLSSHGHKKRAKVYKPDKLYHRDASHPQLRTSLKCDVYYDAADEHLKY